MSRERRGGESVGADSLFFDRFRSVDRVARRKLCKKFLLCTQARSDCFHVKIKRTNAKNLRDACASRVSVDHARNPYFIGRFAVSQLRVRYSFA
jgi:hypothetical protein